MYQTGLYRFSMVAIGVLALSNNRANVKNLTGGSSRCLRFGMLKTAEHLIIAPVLYDVIFPSRQEPCCKLWSSFLIG